MTYYTWTIKRPGSQTMKSSWHVWTRKSIDPSAKGRGSRPLSMAHCNLRPEVKFLVILFLATGLTLMALIGLLLGLQMVG